MTDIWLIPWLSKLPVALLLAFCVFESMFDIQMNVRVFTVTSWLLLIELLASLPHSHNAPLPSLLAHMLCLLLQVAALSNDFLWSSSLTNILHDVYKELIIYFAGVHLCSFALCVLLMCNLAVFTAFTPVLWPFTFPRLHACFAWFLVEQSCCVLEASFCSQSLCNGCVIRALYLSCW